MISSNMPSVHKITSTYDSVLEVIDFIVGRTSESLAEILTKALPLVAPIPNAVSIYFVVQTALGYNLVQALAVAASVECMFFALTEVVLKSWDLWRNSKKTIVPLWISGSAFVVYFLLVMALVYVLEVSAGHSLAPLAFPVVSVVAAVALGVTRWHKRTEQGDVELATVANLVAEKSELVRNHSEQVANLKREHETTVRSLNKQVSSLSETVSELSEQSAQQKPNADKRRQTLFERLRDNVEINVKQLADEFGVSDTVIRRDIAKFGNSAQQFATGD